MRERFLCSMKFIVEICLRLFLIISSISLYQCVGNVEVDLEMDVNGNHVLDENELKPEFGIVFSW